MSFRPPRSLSPVRRDEVFNPLRQEIVQEQAAALAEATRRLERALGRLAEFEESGRPDAARREVLLDAAGEAVWSFVVQRDACGLRNTEAVLKHYRVPAAVRLRMGVAPRRRA